MNSPIAARGPRWAAPIALWTALVLSTVFPRLMLLGGLPATDEGAYAYQAQLMFQSLAGGHGLPDSGTLGLYPLLVSWAFAVPFNTLVLLRMIDLCVAVLSMWLLYRVLAHESGSQKAALFLALIFGFTANQTLFIQYGFKNSIAAAFVPLLLAFHIAQGARAETLQAWWFAGALTALSVLLRETFIPFAVLGFVVVWAARGQAAATRFAAGGCLTAVAVVGLVLLSRGSTGPLINAYRDAGLVYAAITDQSAALFVSNGSLAVQEAMIALALSAAACIALLIRGRRLAARAAFWVLVAALPLGEPMSKIGFPYHFAVSLVGLAGLCSLAWRACSRSSTARLVLPALGALTAVVLLHAKLPALTAHWPQTQQTLAAATSGHWPAPAIGQSNYLLAAEAIRRTVPAGGTVSVSGFMFTLYPLTGHLPPSPALANLSATLIQHGLSSEWLREMLLRCPPDVIMTTTRTEWPGSPELLAAVQGAGIYDEVETIGVTTTRSYGSFGGSIFRVREARPCALATTVH